MGNFCTKCGAMLEADSTFCGKCGTSCNKSASVSVITNTLPRVEAGAASVSSTSKRNQLIGIIVIAIVVTIIAVVAISFISNNYRFVLDSACQAIEGKDYDKLMSCFPPSVQDTYEKYRLDAGQTKRSFLEQSMGNNKVKLSYKVLTENRLSKAYIKSKFLNTDFYDDLETVYELELKCTITLNGDESSSSSTMYVGKIDGKWYIIDSVMSSYNLLGSIM